MADHELRARSRRPTAACGGGCSSNVRPTAGALCDPPQSRIQRSVWSPHGQRRLAWGGDRSALLARSPGRVWRDPRGERATTRRRVRWPRAASSCPVRGTRTAGSLLGRSPCGEWGPSTSRSLDNTKGGPSAHALGVKRVAFGILSRGRSGPGPGAPYDGVGVPAGGFATIDLHADPRRQRCTAKARRSVHAQLAGHIPATTASDAALLVSELVTNSVVHANVGPSRALSVEVTTFDDRVRIAVADPGSRLTPRMLSYDPQAPGGLGLLLVDELCETWGVWQDLGPTCVWCELRSDQSPPRK
jgi:anti-sigma regulatory factor (Ser/Thr protein kinase)